ncbi:allophanate hydrolase [Acidocella aminolytica]|uniref:Amidase/allophanate hydrolase n=1 Tax=Acidocella aminolytica 101 = DSM 11237 TaxID=1120923 RepID=A0A0D6PF01_9PROT|nr:allophanate hydrolase [Acidocella aminolytica]GAN79439.1 amidase/allophanate hydrolase [Acidocella aminolytica 101 = DSM 11237]GBQ43951.1 amidase [Acidocella aminolytica 101 = DSM 11237]SHE45898.1 allophanate hydrolase [Acidocella aminolytica 101 = DSM 11237]
MIPEQLEFSAIHAAYADHTLTPTELVKMLLARIAAYHDKAVFISLVPEECLLAEAASLEAEGPSGKPLYGIPYVVKDNIDVAGLPTTAACPAFAYIAEKDATTVARLRAAGALLLGKANLDQFATGLNGTRSPYGAPRSVFNLAYVSGGSSSGSAVSVGAGLAAFSLGTDTAGSGRVPAAFNNLIGLKPSIGRLSAAGVVPACKSLDCISIFANCAADSMTVLNVAEGYDPADAYSRSPSNHPLPNTPCLGVLGAKDKDFAGDREAAALYETALIQAQSLGWELVEIDYTPFLDIAALLYGGAFVAERTAATRAFMQKHPDDIHPVVRAIIEGGHKFSAADAFDDIYKVQALRQRTRAEFAKCDVLLLPTAPTIFTVEEMLAEPVRHNSTLGIYTNFVNLLDMIAIALPAGFRSDGLPFGVSFVGPAFSEAALSGYADKLHKALGAGAGFTHALPQSSYEAPVDGVTIVVAGAHLSGMALNYELISLGARLVRQAVTAHDYKLYALATTPLKPGLAQTPGFSGAGIAVEVWSLSPEAFGRFVAALPAPMGIGRVTLDDGSVHPGFLCEAYALEGAEDITSYGGWRAYLTER